MHSVTVSIGLPVRNGQRYLAAAVNSILAQDYRDFELIISDNASDDGTESLCRDFAERDTRIRYYRTETNVGCAGNFNRVFHLSRGKYFRWQAYDDECHPLMIGRLVKEFEASPETVVMVYPLGELIDADGRTLESPLDSIDSDDERPHVRVARVLRSLSMCDPGYGLIRSEYLRKTGLMGPFFGGDNVLLCELAMLGKIRQVDEVMFRLRAHEQRSTVVQKSARELALFYDPSSSGSALVFQGQERVVLEVLLAIRRSSLPVSDKMKCYCVAPTTHYLRRLRNSAGRWKRRVKTSLGISSPGVRGSAQT